MQNRGYSTKFIEELKEKCELVSTISKYITLEKKGKTYWACCPFHYEKTPSFAVNETEQYYHCYGCGESGDVIKFIQKYESMNFVESVKFLADSVGLKLPEIEESNQDFETLKLKQNVLKALELSKNFYKENLKKVEAGKAREYLKKREIDGEYLEIFEIGFSTDWTSLVTFLDKQNVLRSIQKSAGLIEFNNSNKPYDVMGGRLIFPIKNAFGDCIGFTARSLEALSSYAKYKNSTQTVVFDKSKTIYNIDQIKEQKKQQKKIDYIIICEGTIDVIAMYKAGFKNTVACMGTAITNFHARELKRFSDKIILCLDDDTAGRNAAYKAIDVLSDCGLEVKVLALKDGLDPDDFLKKYGKNDLKHSLENALDCIEYKLSTLAEKFDLKDNFQKNKYVLSALEIVSKLEGNAQKEIYLKIISSKVNISIDVLRRDLSSNTKNSDSDIKSQALEKQPENRQKSLLKAQKFILASIVHKKDYAHNYKDMNFGFKNPNYKNLFDFVLSQDKNKYTISSIFDHFDSEENDIKEIINFDFSRFDSNPKTYFDQCMERITLLNLTLEQEKLTNLFKAERDLSKRRQIAEKLQKIAKEIKLRNGV